jgi:hypothetical protein
MTNPFTGTGFDMAAMTAAITKLPNLYNRLVPIFRESGIATTTLLVEQMNGTLSIVRSRPRGAPADKVEAALAEIETYDPGAEALTRIAGTPADAPM